MKATDVEIVDFIEDYWRENWTSPAVRTIGRAVGLDSPATVQRRLSRLVERGWLEKKELSKQRAVYRVTAT